jgi:hypothetical protein
MSGAVYRVHWLKAKEQNERAHEEAIIVEHEMLWTVESFRFKQREWAARAGPSASTHLSVGHTEYAMKQAAMYGTFADRACGAFKRTEAIYRKNVM